MRATMARRDSWWPRPLAYLAANQSQWSVDAVVGRVILDGCRHFQRLSRMHTECWVRQSLINFGSQFVDWIRVSLACTFHLREVHLWIVSYLAG